MYLEDGRIWKLLVSRTTKPHATATFTTTPASRKIASVNRRRFTIQR